MRTITNSSFKKWQVLPPFTVAPALSQWERENRSQPHDKSKRGDCRRIIEQAQSKHPPFPLPQGEGESCGNPSADIISQRP